MSCGCDTDTVLFVGVCVCGRGCVCGCVCVCACSYLQRDPAEEALKSNNMNLDQAMSALLEKKTELDKRGGMGGMSDYNNGLINKPMACRPPPPPQTAAPSWTR